MLPGLFLIEMSSSAVECTFTVILAFIWIGISMYGYLFFVYRQSSKKFQGQLL